MQGSTIRLRLLDSVVLENVVVPKGHFVFGLCRLVNQRLLLDIRNIRLGNAIVPVELTMYSLDGMAGLAAPDAVLGDAASAGAADAVGGSRSMDWTGLGDRWQVQGSMRPSRFFPGR
ncbi:conjugative transposon protein TraM [Pedobacter sp. UC225_65]|uniref:conjugative transposon protein TraM n=1 Tax=Pedobacter sp. UC225_65 TaxID=3350173 RepID=UPI00366A939C